jgi:hypothetical protein
LLISRSAEGRIVGNVEKLLEFDLENLVIFYGASVWCEDIRFKRRTERQNCTEYGEFA